MCKILSMSRNLFYYKNKLKFFDTDLERIIISIFESSHNNYGSRKIRVELKRFDYMVSRRRIRQIMIKYNLISNYTLKNFKNHKTACNEEKVPNLLSRKFTPGVNKNVVVSDLTYVNVGGKWHYICVLLDIFNREIIGFSAGKNKDAELVKKAFISVKKSLKKLNIFHTDRGSEFKNEKIDEVLDAFEIDRSLSKKGCPYDNAVAEATFKIIKTELIFNKKFNSLDILSNKLFDYVNWYNNFRVHGSLGYLTPKQYNRNYVTE